MRKAQIAVAILLAVLAIALFVVGFNQWLGLMNEPGFREPTTRETITAAVTLLCVPFGVISFEILTGRIHREFSR